MSTAPTMSQVSSPARWTPSQRYRRSLWLLTTRDLKLRYSTSALGWLWSVLDPLLMSLIYWFVFTQVFHRGLDHPPYIIFLLTGLLPWTWFSGAVGDFTKAFNRDAKLIQSTTIPRTIWVARIVLSKGIEYVFSLPVLAFFVIGTQFFATHADERAHLHWQLALYPLGIVLEALLVFAIGLIIAPLSVFFNDLERAVRLLLRLAFYASPIIFSLGDLGRIHHIVEVIGAINPFSGIVTLFRAGFFPKELEWFPVLMTVAWIVVLLIIGALVFRRTVPSVLKEL